MERCTGGEWGCSDDEAISRWRDDLMMRYFGDGGMT